MLNSQKRKKNTDLSSFTTDFAAENAPTWGCYLYDVIDELQCLSLSKYLPVLCYIIIHEIVIFHSINGETCDKQIFAVGLLCC